MALMSLALGGFGGLDFGCRRAEPPKQTTFPRNDAAHIAAAEEKRRRKAKRKAELSKKEKP